MMKTKTPKINNYVAKHVQQTGAGVHVDKNGKKVPRCKEKKRINKMIEHDMQTIGIPLGSLTNSLIFVERYL